MPHIPIVNEQDEVIGYKERTEKAPEDIFRVATLWLTNSKGEILLAQRSASKRDWPNYWGPAAAGTLEEGETYDSNIIKEVEEEIGLHLKIEQLTKAEKIRFKKVGGSLNQFYTYCADLPVESFVLQEEEVQAVRWITPEHLIQEYKEDPTRFVPSMPYWLYQFIPEAAAFRPTI